MNPTQPSGLFGSIGTFTLLLNAVGFWFAAAGFARFTPQTGDLLLLIALCSAVLAVLLFGLTVRSALFAGSTSRRRRRRYSN